jgi:FkbM family methyltransferase
MPRLAASPIAPLLGQRLPMRAQARLLNRSYQRMQRRTGRTDLVLTTGAGDLFQADLGSFQEWHRWVYGSLEDQVALFSRLIQPGNRCVDVGAGIGLHTVRLAKLTGSGGDVMAVEPDPEKARRAARNIALNGLTNVRVIQAAASDAARTAVADPEGPTEHTSAITIDEACPSPVALIRIDAGGREAAVVAGAGETIERDHPAIVLEHVPELITDDAECSFGRLVDAGYLLYRISSRRRHVTGRYSLCLDPVYAQPETDGALLAVSERDATRIISLVASRDGRT